jgi:hypothetical protein
VEGVWVVGGVELTSERRIFACTVTDRTRETMKDIITRFVKPGSIIRTDFWGGYLGLEDWGQDYVHQRVNHSEEYVSFDGVHTKTIEGTWNGIKMLVQARHRTADAMPWRLVEFIWRRVHQGNHWNALLETLANVEFDRLIGEDAPGTFVPAGPRVPAFTQHRRVEEEEEEEDAFRHPRRRVLSPIVISDSSSSSSSEDDDSDDFDWRQ